VNQAGVDCALDTGFVLRVESRNYHLDAELSEARGLTGFLCGNEDLQAFGWQGVVFQVLRCIETGAGPERSEQQFRGVIPVSAPPLAGGWSLITR
jgi:hypothetical protein